jgi:hypothetical protein
MAKGVIAISISDHFPDAGIELLQDSSRCISRSLRPDQNSKAVAIPVRTALQASILPEAGPFQHRNPRLRRRLAGKTMMTLIP